MEGEIAPWRVSVLIPKESTCPYCVEVSPNTPATQELLACQRYG